MRNVPPEDLGLRLWQHPAGYGWFLNVNGLQDCDYGYERELDKAIDHARKGYPGCKIHLPPGTPYP